MNQFNLFSFNYNNLKIYTIKTAKIACSILNNDVWYIAIYKSDCIDKACVSSWMRNHFRSPEAVKQPSKILTNFLKPCMADSRRVGLDFQNKFSSL